jgi:hypothetical protein
MMWLDPKTEGPGLQGWVTKFVLRSAIRYSGTGLNSLTVKRHRILTHHVSDTLCMQNQLSGINDSRINRKSYSID